MTALLILVPGACYAVAAILYAQKGDWPLAVVYAGYCVANGGLLALDMRT